MATLLPPDIVGVKSTITLIFLKIEQREYALIRDVSLIRSVPIHKGRVV